MSPVCKKCRNYVMKLPCPHCGGDMALTDRDPDEIKPIIPVDLQETFDKPPQPEPTISSSTDSQFPPKPIPSPTYSPPPTAPPIKSEQPTYSPPPLAQSMSMEQPIKQEAPPPVPKQARPKSTPPPPVPKSSFISTKSDLDKIPLDDDLKKRLKDYDQRIKELEKLKKDYESQVKKYRSKFKEVDDKLKNLEKGLKILLKTHENIESVYKESNKHLKKTV